MSRRARPVIGLVTLCAIGALVTGCTAGADEPPGLSTESGPSAESAPPSDDESQTTEAEPTEPSSSFTQPFVPGEESVITLAAELPIEPPDDATDEEREVLRAAGRSMASWDAILFGAGEEESRIHETTVDPQLSRLINYAVESVAQRRVTVGEPTAIDLLDVSITDDTAEVDMCITMKDWVKYTQETPEPQDELERLVVTLVRQGDRWLASNSNERDVSSCT